MNNDDMESVLQKAIEKVKLTAPEDNVTRHFHKRACTSMEIYNSMQSFQRGDYLELAKIVQVCIRYAPCSISEDTMGYYLNTK